ncbi:hypothetical protein [Cellulomonas dongxiuzhuiae]|uniref:hypothetical protein n=1 Tax=Cellulomonas dongxiuzhuiae TaxID=2819979 RepID=UPI001AAF1443|nr:hypothetical protein [Cellulomonas dongxiuzhuiae]MBO3089351.1 hypothetical protein [Cellulomonas dongxiuzhuiae]
MERSGLRGRPRGARTGRATAVRLAVALAVTVPLVAGGTGPATAVALAGTSGTTTVDEQAGDVTYYVVKESWEGQPEFLFSIAERLLGTGDRALEIYELNEGRAQPGGMTVSDPNVIRPGWVLLLPPDAVGDGVVVGPLPTLPPVAVRPTPTPSPAPGATEHASGSGATDGSSAAASDDAPATSLPSFDPGTVALVALAVSAGIGVLVLLVGGGVGVVRRRRARRDAPPAPVVHREDPGAWTIDRTTRALARACADAGRAVPGVHALVLADDEVHLRLRTPDVHPPAGWSATDDGRTWTSPMRPLQDVALDAHVVAPFPGLVTLGDDVRGRVLVDLAQAGPGICLEGDAAEATRLAERWLHELASSPWSRHVPVVAVGLGGSSYGRLDEAGDAITAAAGGVLVVADARRRDAERLALLAEDPAWAVVVVGAAGRDWARWRLTLDAEGVATGGPLDTDVHVRTGAPRLELV